MTKESNNRMSIRLDEQSNVLLEKAAESGISKTSFINEAIHNAPIKESINRRKVQPHLAELQTILNSCDDPDLKKRMRKELHEICQYLSW